MKNKNNRRGKARQEWLDSGLDYIDIGAWEMHLLLEMLQYELSGVLKDNMRLYLRAFRKDDAHFSNKDRSLKRCNITVDGSLSFWEPFFEEYECITFHDTGFIGFAGWADNDNIEPIVNAFTKWVSLLSIIKKEIEEYYGNPDLTINLVKVEIKEKIKIKQKFYYGKYRGTYKK